MSEKKHYSDEKNVQILVALLKEHGVKKAILSPGSANSPLVASLQYDDFFECYSCVDERSAAYMACGLAEEAGEPVILSCTGATASRNYLPGITEAFYRKLPIIAITSTQPVYRVGQHIAQVVDRSIQPNDTYLHSVTLPIIKDSSDARECVLKVNTSIIHSTRRGGGPVHINLQTSSLSTYTTEALPSVRRIEHFSYEGLQQAGITVPEGRITIHIGSHTLLSPDATLAIDDFCERHDAAVVCDHTSQYSGRFKVLGAILGAQHLTDLKELRPQLTIHIGEVSGDYYSPKLIGAEVWRVNSDGEIRDTFGKLTKVFEMSEAFFFRQFTAKEKIENQYFVQLNAHVSKLRSKHLDLPFSNIWVASQLAPLLPEDARLHFGILNSLRSWNFFHLKPSIRCNSNTGGFGIDGCISSLCGASFNDSTKLYFGVFGDLAFFYDLNVLGNRHLSKNLRILLINNGLGTEFKTYKHHTSHFGDDADQFISAAGHFGQKSPDLVKNYAENLGFQYFSASDKASFNMVSERFVDPVVGDFPILFEVFTDSEDESKALEIMMNIEVDSSLKAKKSVENIGRTIFGKTGISVAKKVLGR